MAGMQCPKCMGTNTTLISDTHYVCNNASCVNDDGTRVQFKFVMDKKIGFPYNQIFTNRQRHEFYRKPYLELASTGAKNVTV